MAKRKNKQDGSTTSNSMDTISTYPNHRTINELKSLFDLLEEIIFRIFLWMALKTLVAGRETLLWIILFLSFQRWKTTAWKANFLSRRFLLRTRRNLVEHDGRFCEFAYVEFASIQEADKVRLLFFCYSSESLEFHTNKFAIPKITLFNIIISKS